MGESYEAFDWEQYLLKNSDLQIDGIITPEDAWKHWINYGKKENRVFYVKSKMSLMNDYMVLWIDEYINHLDNKNSEEEKTFDWVLYLCSNPDVFLKGIQNEEQAKKHWSSFGKIEKRTCFLENYNDMVRHEFLYFRWNRYIKQNGDLKDIDNPFNSWKHWLYCGIKEERATYLINNSKIHNGRLGNLFFINMAAHFLSIKYNLMFNYKYFNKFKKLGINLFVGTNTYRENIILGDKSFYDLIFEKDFKKKNIVFTNEMWCQTQSFCYVLKNYFGRAKIKINIIKNNLFKKRYEKNNDLFIHLRLGDVESRVTNIYNSYDSVISDIEFTNGFLSSDDINNDICKRLIDKHKLKIYNSEEIETIMFASTCNHIILSGGTFSWLIGFLAFFSKNIYYPRIKNKWYGNIFVLPDWKMFDTINV